MPRRIFNVSSISFAASGARTNDGRGLVLRRRPEIGGKNRSAGGHPSRVAALCYGRPSLLSGLGAWGLLGKFSRGRCDPLLGFGESSRGAAHLRDECV
jgi:hypothetical protein